VYQPPDVGLGDAGDGLSLNVTISLLECIACVQFHPSMAIYQKRLACSPSCMLTNGLNLVCSGLLESAQ